MSKSRLEVQGQVQILHFMFWVQLMHVFPNSKTFTELMNALQNVHLNIFFLKWSLKSDAWLFSDLSPSHVTELKRH